MKQTVVILSGLSLLTLGACTAGDGKTAKEAPQDKQAAVAPAEVATTMPNRVYWGDEHIHTGWSGDAGLAGGTLSPEDAIRFVRGESVKSSTGIMAKLERPLDWAAITDHSDGMGTINELRAGNPEMMADPTAARWRADMNAGGVAAITAAREAISAQATGKLPKIFMDPKWIASAWQKNIAVMDRYNEPGKFTAFIAFEWSSQPGGDNIHRNVIFRDNGKRAGQITPLTTFVSKDPAVLWKWLADYEVKTGGQVLAIPHNGNLSNGRMFEETTFDGGRMTADWARQRARWEPLFEIFQTKGSSEANIALSPTDELSQFENWDTANLNGVSKQPGMKRTEYLREALKSGMRIQGQLGVNPFHYGMAAGTDTHTGLSTPIEDNYMGEMAANEPRPDRWSAPGRTETNGYLRRAWTAAAQGYTGVWAAANTREAIWDAMKRRETYASSGPRITVRFFGGYDFAAADAQTSDMAATGYARGVPMGGQLARPPKGKVPTFLIAAMKDPAGANLDRVQVVKGWVDGKGVTQERVFDVLWSDPGRRKVNNGRLDAVGDTVDVATASYRNSIGAAELRGTFRDPEFDARQRAFYYARVVEIPTPRWTAFDALRFKVKLDPEVTTKLQERAVTSPIWYTPGS
jgi:hypothetical protein